MGKFCYEFNRLDAPGWASVDPNRPDCIEHLDHCVNTLKLKPVYQHFDPPMGHPWETDLIVLIRKCPNMYTDISAVHYRPWRYWQAMVTAMEYGVEHKILPGSDFPSGTMASIVAGLRNVDSLVKGTKLPTISEEVQDMVLYENWKAFFPDWA